MTLVNVHKNRSGGIANFHPDGAKICEYGSNSSAQPSNLDFFFAILQNYVSSIRGVSPELPIMPGNTLFRHPASNEYISGTVKVVSDDLVPLSSYHQLYIPPEVKFSIKTWRCRQGRSRCQGQEPSRS